MFVQEVRSDVARSAERHVAIFARDCLPGLREPVMEKRGVLAAVDRPEEGVADRLSLVRRGAIARHEEAGVPILLAERVIHQGKVNRGHALHLQKHVAQQRVMVDAQLERARRHLPSRIRLHAGREAPVRDDVGVLAGLFERLTVELDVRIGCNRVPWRRPEARRWSQSRGRCRTCRGVSAR